YSIGRAGDNEPISAVARLTPGPERGSVAQTEEASMSTSGNRGPPGRPRGIGFGILMFIVTLHFYSWYWVFKTQEEIKQHTGEGLARGSRARAREPSWSPLRSVERVCVKRAVPGQRLRLVAGRQRDNATSSGSSPHNMQDSELRAGDNRSDNRSREAGKRARGTHP